jgi:hypothetical protein
VVLWWTPDGRADDGVFLGDVKLRIWTSGGQGNESTRLGLAGYV